jgi:1-piperideine-2-carboxylate/1-pyrroline-2-carboxylate reductase [NAD(P)H]
MRIFDSERTRQALPYARLVPAVAEAVRQLAAGEIVAPERQVVPVGAGGVLLSMPAIGRDIGVTKLITVHEANARHQLPVIQGEVIVFDTATGRRLALLDGPTVTARRTAAMTLLGIETLAGRRPASALLIGTGVQAAAHADALIAYFGVSVFHIAGSSQEGAERFAAALAQRHPGIALHALTAASLQDEVPETDVLIALTTATVPVIPSGLPPATLAIGVGAFKPHMAEFPPPLLHARQIVVDDLSGARHEAGDLIQAGVDWSRVRPLSDFIGKGNAPQGAYAFKTVGQAAWDLAAARVALGAQ